MNPNEQNPNPAPAPVLSTALSSATPEAPKNLTPEETAKLQEEAKALALQVKSRLTDPLLGQEISTMGSDVEEQAGAEMSLLNQRVGKVMKDLDGEGSQIPQNLMKLRKIADQVNPHAKLAEIENMNGLKRFALKAVGKLPGIGDVLQEIGYKYESVQVSIDEVVNGIRAGCDQLLQDNIALGALYKKVQQTDAEVQRVAYRGELLWQQLEQELAVTTDPGERAKLEAIIGMVARRVQDLRTMEAVFGQFYASIDMTISNNVSLIDSGKRTTVVTKNVLTIGLAIQAALAQQKRVAQAVVATQQYTSDVLAANAKAIRTQSVEIAELQNNPVLALDKVKEAHADLIAAMNEVDRIRAQGVVQAKSAIAQLSTMNEAMRQRSGAFASTKDASKLLAEGGDNLLGTGA